MLEDIGISANGYFSFSNPSNSFANIFNVFACCCNNNIAWRSFLAFSCQSFRNKGFSSFGRGCLIVGINLPIVDAADTAFDKVFLLDAAASDKVSNLPQLLKRYAVGAKLCDELFYFVHSGLCVKREGFHFKVESLHFKVEAFHRKVEATYFSPSALGGATSS